MKLIRNVRIENFRSIQNQVIPDAGVLNGLVGKNSCGKSNALRALNLFFNGEIEPGKRLNFPRDHYQQIPRRQKKKRISISVDFSLPPNFRLRKGLAHLQTLGTEFRITRYWELDQFRSPQETFEVFVNDQPIPDGAELGRQFLTLITYRYIPNRTIPSAILKNESQAIANSIFGRMKGDQHGAALLQALTAAAERMMETAGKSLQRIGSPLITPSVSTGESIGEMLKMSGFQATGAHGLSVQDEDWGAGHQSFFLYQVLCELDTSYGRFFGWKQATVWGVEEPEAGLHRDLETRLADQFREWCLNEGLKLQIFTTTHSSIFTMASDVGYWVELSGKETVFKPLAIPQLTQAAETRGVSGWVHPILYFPWNPVVLAEGPIDAAVLSHVSTLAGLDNLRFVSLPNLDPSERRGGKDKIITFLKNSHGLVHNRPRQAPLFVLFDWDVTQDELRRAKEAYGPNADVRVLCMDHTHSSPMLSRDFKGIERFYPSEVFREAHEAGELVLGIAANRPYSISQSQLEAAKGTLSQRVLRIDAVDKLGALLHVVVDIESKLHANHPVQISLPGISR